MTNADLAPIDGAIGPHVHFEALDNSGFCCREPAVAGESLMRIRAIVREVSGDTLHVQGTQVGGRIEVTTIPAPIAIEIAEQESGVSLLRLDAAGQCIADTWHETVEAAKTQANFEFGTGENEWKAIN
jgi:hypothetical protein